MAAATCSRTIKLIFEHTAGPGVTPEGLPKESQMPKIKTKSGAKKRFKVTGGPARSSMRIRASATA